MLLQPNEQKAIAIKAMRIKHSAISPEQKEAADRYERLFMRRIIREYHEPITPGEKLLGAMLIGFVLSVVLIVSAFHLINKVL